MNDIITLANGARLAYKGSILENDKFSRGINLEKFIVRLSEYGFLRPIPIQHKDLFAYIVRKDGFTYIFGRGTANKENFMRDIDYGWIKTEEGKVYKGFILAAIELLPFIKSQIDKGELLKVGGHSFASALMQIIGNKLAEEKFNVVCAVTIGSPRVGDKEYIKNTTGLFPRYEIINNLDIVPELPTKWGGWKHYPSLYLTREGKLKDGWDYFDRKKDRFMTLVKHRNIKEYLHDH